MLANLTYLIVKDYRHKLLFIVAILIGFISLTCGQALIERVFALEIRISMIIESVGGSYSLSYFTGGPSVKLKTLINPFKNRILQDIISEVRPETDSLYWSKWCWKINFPLHHEQTDQERSGNFSIKGREIESWNCKNQLKNHHSKAENQLPSQIDR